MWTKTVIAAVAIATVATAAPASAESYKFRYRAHELQTDGGRAALMARLDAQVGRYCAVDDARGLHTKRAANACKDEVKSEIVAKIKNAAFASLQ
ncbi:MAG: UrcA family protein [Parvularculaceae bacterium]